MLGAVANTPRGFEYVVRRDTVLITHRGRLATTLRGAGARGFLAALQDGDPQQLMARATGNYRHGNERPARQHPRNRGS